MRTTHLMRLTKSHTYESDNAEQAFNTFVFDEKKSPSYKSIITNNIRFNNGVFVVLDKNGEIQKEVKESLADRNYYIEKLDSDDPEGSLKMNPFFAVSNHKDLHFLFDEMLIALGSGSDPDKKAMSEYIDATANYVWSLLPKEKRSFTSFLKIMGSISIPIQDTTMFDAVFHKIEDQSQQAFIYYSQFLADSGERKMEIAKKVLDTFDKLSPEQKMLLSGTEADMDNLQSSLNYKTAFFVAEKEGERWFSNIMLVMLNQAIRDLEVHRPVLFVIDDYKADNKISVLTYWLKSAGEHRIDYLICSSDIKSFKENATDEKYMKEFVSQMFAIVLVHANEENIATLLVHTNNIAVEDEVI